MFTNLVILQLSSVGDIVKLSFRRDTYEDHYA